MAVVPVVVVDVMLYTNMFVPVVVYLEGPRI